MKKIILGVCLLLALIVLPNEVNAEIKASIVYGNEDGTCETKSNTTQKVTTCKLYIENTGDEDIKGLVLGLDLEPGSEVIGTAKFVADAKYAKVNYEPSDKEDHDYELTISAIPVGAKIQIGSISGAFSLSATKDECGIDIKTYWAGSNVTSRDYGNESNNVNTGYAVPYIALAFGITGVVTVVALSKKKTKMFKI